MLYATSAMTDQVRECNANNTLFLNDAASVKVEERQDEDFVDDKVNIYETTIIIDNNLICDKIKDDVVSTTLDNIKSELSSSNVGYNAIKIEEGLNTDDIKIELNKRLLYCEDCQAYREEYCADCDMLVHIMNRTVAVNTDNRLGEELPHDILQVQDHFGQFCILALKVVPADVRFGPFTGINTTEHHWKIKGGKFVVNKDKSKYLNWMQHINPARNIYEQNLQVFQYEHNLYYQSTRLIQKGDELLVYFGKKYEDSLNRNVEMDFIPTVEHIFKDAFACSFCCLGFSSKSYLAKHKTVCLRSVAGGFSIEELTQCPSCKVYLDQKEYILHHMSHCCRKNNRKFILSTPGNRWAQGNDRKTRPCRKYKCQQCKYRTNYKGDLKSHINLHYEMKIYKCEVCCRRFKTKDVLRWHVENTQMCAGAKEEDPERSARVYMSAHIKPEYSCSRDETKQFKCTLCEFRTKYKRSLKNHMKVKHLKEFRYKCDTCDYATYWKSYLRTHIDTRHLKHFKYKCDICDYKTNQKSNLRSHIETKHLSVFKYRCDACDYKANQEFQLRAHIETRHLKEFKYTCDVCDYKTNFKSSLSGHMKTKHLKEFKYKCDTCDYKTTLKSSLKKHVGSRHLKEFKYKCGACDYKSNWKFELNKHVETRHLKEFKHRCDACGYQTNRKSDLRIHTERKHLKEFKYKCDACEYKANHKSQLTYHVDTKHLKTFKYNCDMCDYKGNWKSSLTKHIERKHLKEFKYKCDTCDYKTYWKTYFKKHLQTTHLK